MFGSCVSQSDATSPNRFKNCLVQQQFIFVRQLRFAAERSVYFAHANCKLFSLDAFSNSVCHRGIVPSLASSARGILRSLKVTGEHISLWVVNVIGTHLDTFDNLRKS